MMTIMLNLWPFIFIMFYTGNFALDTVTVDFIPA